MTLSLSNNNNNLKDDLRLDFGRRINNANYRRSSSSSLNDGNVAHFGQSVHALLASIEEGSERSSSPGPNEFFEEEEDDAPGPEPTPAPSDAGLLSRQSTLMSFTTLDSIDENDENDDEEEEEAAVLRELTPTTTTKGEPDHKPKPKPKPKVHPRPVLVQDRGDGQAMVSLLLDDGEGFLDDIDAYINGDFDMFSFGAIAEMMGDPEPAEDVVCGWVERTRASCESESDRDRDREAVRSAVERPTSPPEDALVGYGKDGEEGEDVERPETPVGLSESDREELERPFTPSTLGEEEEDVVGQNLSAPPDTHREDGTAKRVIALPALNARATAAHLSDTTSASADPIRSTSTSTNAKAAAIVRSLLPAVAAAVSSGASALNSLTFSGAGKLKRKASDADLDEARSDGAGKDKDTLSEGVKRQRTLMRQRSQTSVGSL